MNNLSTTSKVMLGLGLTALVYMAGVMTAKNYIKPNIIVKTDTKVLDHTVTVIKTVKEPNGVVETTTTVDDDKTTSIDTLSKIQDPTKDTTIALSYGMDFSDTIPRPVYGVQASKKFIGPLSLGVYALTNKTIGLSIGYSF